jgi:ParB family chromosome partitioning protein
MPEAVQERCRQADIESKSMLLQIVRQETEDEMHRLIDRISGEGITREEARKHNRPEGERRPRRFVYRFEPEDQAYQFSLSFAKPQVEREELVKALQSVLEKLLREMREEPTAERGATARRQGNVHLDA